MFSETPELYDLIYSSFKDYAFESQAIATLLGELAPHCREVLDVACGTGEHARHLQSTHGYHVDGLDIDPGFLELARTKLTGSTLWQGDMADFSLSKSYDAILCLFSSIGYVKTPKRLRSTLSCFRKHLRPGGVALIEPWYEPDAWSHGGVYVQTSESDRLRVVRMSHSTTRDQLSVLDFQYLVGTPDGIEHRVETHELALFTREEMLASFAAADFDEVTHDAEGMIGRGMYIARVDAG